MSKLMPDCPANCTLCSPGQPTQGPAELQGAHALTSRSTELAGWRLLWQAFGALLLPVFAGLAGVLLAGEGEGRRLIGLAAGLGLGMAVAILVAQIARRRSRRRGIAKESA